MRRRQISVLSIALGTILLLAGTGLILASVFFVAAMLAGASYDLSTPSLLLLGGCVLCELAFTTLRKR
jgi:hypothetical protein